jgi:oxygen-independent coproporphyrinogen-3 oxidase
MQTECQRLLSAAGFLQYEVSAYAKGAAYCRHNLNYWQFGDYVGIGAGAHGKLSIDLPQNILRTAKPKQPRDFQARLREPGAAIGERTSIDTAELPFEFMLNALRLNEGFESDAFEARTGLPIGSIEASLGTAQARGLLETRGRSWRPTELGRRFLNDLQQSFLR